MIYNVKNTVQIPQDQWASAIWRLEKEGKVTYRRFDPKRDFWVEIPKELADKEWQKQKLLLQN